MILFMSAKSKMFEKYKMYEAWAKAQRKCSVINELQLDQEGEYMSKEFTCHLEKQGTICRLAAHNLL
jgi:hypothetical protein